MKLSDYLSEKFILVNPPIQDKNSLIKSISSLAVQHPVLKGFSEKLLFEELMKRENLGSTGFGKKIAIPHCSIDGIDDFVIGIIILKNGIDFDSLDSKKIHIFFFIIAPSDQRNKHINFLSAISGVLKNPEAVEKIISANSPQTTKEIVLKYTLHKADIESKQAFNILHIFIQKEDRFEEILNILTEVIAVNISVLEANNARQYLYSLPLFSSFWNNEEKGFQRLIIAVLEKSRTNDIIRKLNMVIEAENNDPGILILMQNIAYANGAIEI